MQPVSPIKAFLRDLDRQWTPLGGGPIRLPFIGSTALMLLADYERGTKDGDVLQVAALGGDILEALQQLAGPGSPLHRKHRFYLDLVAPAIPFLPRAPQFTLLREFNAGLTHFEIQALAVVDVIVSKLKRLSGNDLSDIQAMVDLELVDHGLLLRRFRSALDAYSLDARAEDFPAYVRNLNRIERDFLQVQESTVPLP